MVPLQTEEDSRYQCLVGRESMDERESQQGWFVKIWRDVLWPEMRPGSQAEKKAMKI